MSNRPKLTDISKTALEYLFQGNLRYSNHAEDRLNERKITRQDVHHVIENGFHEKREDRWDPDRKCWKYAMRCQNIDETTTLRIILVIDEDIILLVTVIDLNQEKTTEI